MKDDLLPSQLCTALMRVGTRMATEFDKHFNAQGVTQAQFRVLLAVWERGGGDGITPSALADYLLIERATVSVLTGRMVERGWLARLPGANRRTFRLALTETGSRTLQELIPRAVALADATLAGVVQDDLRRMWASLESVEARLRTGESPEEPEE